MSTYLDPRYPEKHSDYSDVPEDVQAFLRYLESTLRRSPRTVNAYYVDLRIFLRFMVRYQQQIDKKNPGQRTGDPRFGHYVLADHQLCGSAGVHHLPEE